MLKNYLTNILANWYTLCKFKGDIMEFIKRRKTREYIELGLKALASVLAVLMLAILLEAMIYSIFMKKIDEHRSSSYSSYQYSLYIAETDDNTYNVYIHSWMSGQDEWTRHLSEISQERLDEFLRKPGVLWNETGDLYKIVATKTSDSTTTEYTKSDSQTALEQITAELEETQSEYTFAIYFRESAEAEYSTTATKSNLTYAQLKKENENSDKTVREAAHIYWRAPNCFEIYMNGWHYAILVFAELIVLGVWGWVAVLTAKEYQKIEKRFKKTGKVF